MHIDKDGGGSTSLRVWDDDLTSDGVLVIPDNVKYFFDNDCHCGDKLRKIVIPAGSRVIMSGWWSAENRAGNLEAVVINNIQYKYIVIKSSSNSYKRAYLAPQETYDAQAKNKKMLYQAYEFEFKDGSLSQNKIFVCEANGNNDIDFRGVGKTENDAKRDFNAKIFSWGKLSPTKITERVSMDRAAAIYALLTCYCYKAESSADRLAESLRKSGMVSEKNGAVKIKNFTLKEFFCRMSVSDPEYIEPAVVRWNLEHGGKRGLKSEQISFGKSLSENDNKQFLGDCINCKLLQDMNIANVHKKCAFAKIIHSGKIK